MTKQNLSRVYVYRGRFYGPGEVDLPEDVARELASRERGQAERAEAAPSQQEQEQEPPEQSQSDSMPRHVLDLETLSSEQKHELYSAGYTSLDALREASDDDLVEVERVGKQTVRRMRAELRQRKQSE